MNIKKLRLEKGLSQKDVAKYLGVTQQAYANYERGARQADYSTLEKLAVFFNVSIDYLLDVSIDTIVFLDCNKVKMLPLFESVCAAFGADASDEVKGYVPFYIDNEYEAQNSVCLKVWGDSMSPKIENGDIIQAVKQTSVDNGSLAVALIDGEEGIVKRVVHGKTWIELHSINPAYPMQRFENEDVHRVNIVGLVRKIIKNV